MVGKIVKLEALEQLYKEMQAITEAGSFEMYMVLNHLLSRKAVENAAQDLGLPQPTSMHQNGRKILDLLQEEGENLIVFYEIAHKLFSAQKFLEALKEKSSELKRDVVMVVCAQPSEKAMIRDLLPYGIKHLLVQPLKKEQVQAKIQEILQNPF